MLFWQLCFRTYFVVCLQDYKRIVGDVGRGNYCSLHAVLLTLRPLCFHFNQWLLGPSLQSVLPFIHNYYCCSLIMLLHLRRMLKPGSLYPLHFEPIITLDNFITAMEGSISSTHTIHMENSTQLKILWLPSHFGDPFPYRHFTFSSSRTVLALIRKFRHHIHPISFSPSLPLNKTSSRSFLHSHFFVSLYLCWPWLFLPSFPMSMALYHGVKNISVILPVSSFLLFLVLLLYPAD